MLPFFLSLGQKTYSIQKYTIFIYVLHIKEGLVLESRAQEIWSSQDRKAVHFLCGLVTCFLSDVYVSDESRICFELDKALLIDISKYSVKPFDSKEFIWSLKLELSGLRPKMVSMCSRLSVGRIWHDWSHVARFYQNIFVFMHCLNKCIRSSFLLWRFL